MKLSCNTQTKTNKRCVIYHNVFANRSTGAIIPGVANYSVGNMLP